MNIRPLVLLPLAVSLAVPPISAQERAAASRPAVSQSAAKTAQTHRPQARPAAKPSVASSELKPMARQLLESRSAAAYGGLEGYALRHEDQKGALAWLVVGYARTLDRQWPQAIAALRKAQPQAGELRDYADYLLASAYALAGEQEKVAATLAEFHARHPGSVFQHEARLLHADALLSTGKVAAGIAVLEAGRQPLRPDLELALARAYLRSGQTIKAVQAFRRVYYELPLSAEATEAGRELNALGRRTSIPAATLAQRKQRAQRLASGRRNADAASELRSLLADSPASEQRELRVALAAALYRSRQATQARQILDAMEATAADDEPNAQRLHLLAEIARSARDEQRLHAALDELRHTAPASTWLEESLLSAGNMYMLQGDFARASALYLEIPERFPQGRHAAFTHWRAAWLTYRMGESEAAARLFEAQIQRFPASAEVSAAMYWRGRLAEDAGQPALARSYYEKLAERFQHFYYAQQARERLAALGSGDPDPVPILGLIPPPGLAPALAQTTAPNGNLRARKSRLLESAGLPDFAIRELQRASAEVGGAWAGGEIARIHRENNRPDLALQVLKRSLPGYFSVDLDALPRDYWEGLFPRAYWTDLKRYSAEAELDPFLVASLIRQESEFRAGAVSAANAIGLMQLLPSTALTMAREFKIRYSRAQLTQPAFNKRLGTLYLRKRLDNFDGQVEYALAAYNAGAHRVQEWLANGTYRDVQEFVESIPFTETREYVQAVLRNKRLYEQLYGQP